MAKMVITIHICDSCKTEGENLNLLTVTHRRETKRDAAGSIEQMFGTIDLCPECVRSLVYAMTRELSVDAAVAFFDKRYGNKLRIE